MRDSDTPSQQKQLRWKKNYTVFKVSFFGAIEMQKRGLKICKSTRQVQWGIFVKLDSSCRLECCKIGSILLNYRAKLYPS